MFISLVAYGVAVLPLMFLQSFVHQEAASGYVAAVIINILTGLFVLALNLFAATSAGVNQNRRF